MFERFTADARQAVVAAQHEARSLRHDRIGTEHLLLGVLAHSSPATVALAALGLTHDSVRPQVAEQTAGLGSHDEAALADLGIDVEEVRRRVEAQFGVGALDVPAPRRLRRRPWRRRGSRRGHIRFTPAAKKSLELALREALALRSREITAAHVVLGLLRDRDSVAARVVRDLGADDAAVRRAMLDQATRAA
jgi:ATP-dependent Clp protease ATP-binding subunit ClpA